MKSVPTLLRLAEHKALSQVTLSGTVLDLGGDSHAEYRKCLKGNFTVHTVNLDPKTSPDTEHDLETALPFADNTYDNALLINVLEHVYHARELLLEAVRVVKPDGTIVVIVPFLFPVHADPHDYWRFSRETLEKLCAEAGLQTAQISALGSGVFAARYVLLDRLMPYSLRFFGSFVLQPFVLLFDLLFTGFARALGKKYDSADYALGYCVTARR